MPEPVRTSPRHSHVASQARPRRAARLRWAGVLLLVALGIQASVGRALIIAGHSSTFTDAPLMVARWLFPPHAAEFQAMEQHFARTAPSTLIHVVAGGLFLAFGLLQFSARMRARRPRVHRWSGRALVVVAAIAGATGIWKGVVEPFSTTERLPTAALGLMFLVAPIIGLIAIRRGDVARHREWMIRFYAGALSIVAVRLLSPAIVWLSDPAPIQGVVGTTFWAGWIVTQAAAELWIRRDALGRAGHGVAAAVQRGGLGA